MKSFVITIILSVINILPQPYKLEEGSGEYVFGKTQTVYFDPSFGEIAREEFNTLCSQIQLTSRHKLKFAKSPSGIAFIRVLDIVAEGYTLDISSEGVVVKASDDHGLFYALQTLKQLLPVDFFGKGSPDKRMWTLPYCHIEDHPQFSYRGMHLDCARHMFSVAELKKYLDMMALLKMNHFHWHLTDDQGWRIEVSSFPKLMETSAWRSGTQIGMDRSSSDGVKYGGYYTKEQIREIVSYASKYGIEVIPEIDLPGHMVSVLAAYPEFGCTGGPYDVWTHWGISPDVLCAGNPAVYEFLEKVIDEVAELFPCEYFHIGGDECPKTRWEVCPKCQQKIRELKFEADSRATAEQRLQNYFMSRVQSFLNNRGKKAMAWDEILEGDPAKGTLIMSWRGAEPGIRAANSGFDVIMTPYEYMYFDYCQFPEKPEGFIGPRRLLPLEKVYSLDPYYKIEESKRAHIIGVQSNLWTEYISDDKYLEFMLLPRVLATSEIQWCSPENKDFDRFTQTLERKWLGGILDILGYNYYHWKRIPSPKLKKDGFCFYDIHDYLQGQGWKGINDYTRIPKEYKERFRPELWRESLKSAGLNVNFHTNSSDITIRYALAGGPSSMPHMPSTGVSGVDLYGKGKDGVSRWCMPKYSWKDTVVFRYSNLSYTDSLGYDFKLSLPAYKTVLWMEIGIKEGREFYFLPQSESKPIVIYGTSIAHGACPSRPGLAWPEILSRESGLPIINLGFSGNAWLEPEMFDALCEVDAGLYILDCMQNNKAHIEWIYPRMLDGIRKLRKSSRAPILIVEHQSDTGEWSSYKVGEAYRKTNVELKKVYETLVKEKVEGLFYMSSEEISLPMDSMVDGYHPNDFGMRVYADAYLKKLKTIFR